MKKTGIFLALAFSGLILSLLYSCAKSSADNVQFIPVQKTDGGAWIFINDKGERVGEQEWEFEPTVTIDGVFTARNDSGLTVYRWDGKAAKPVDSLQNLVSVGVYNEGLIPVVPAMKRIRVVDKKGNVKFTLDPIDGQEISSCAGIVQDGMLVVTTVDGKTGVVNDKGEVVVKPTYSDISNFTDGFALAVDYNYDTYEDGPTYFVIDKNGNSVKVEGKFGYEEGECASLSSFENGIVTVAGEMDTVNYSMKYVEINTAGQVVEKENESLWTTYLDNGGKIVYKYADDKSEYSWFDKDGKILMKTSESGESINAYGKFVTLTKENSLTVYDLEAKELNKLDGQFWVSWPGGGFGLLLHKHDANYKFEDYILLDQKGQPVETAKFFGVGENKVISNSNYEDEIDCGGYYVTSAYVDVTAAASKLVSMITDGVKGKSTYYLGESVKTILDGENANYLSGNKFSIPTDSGTYYLATGAGFTINGEAKASTNIVAPTYQNYFEVHHYDYWGRAWGWKRKRQVGVHLNASAKVVSFDLKLRTNHPSGTILRDAVSRRLKKDGYTLVDSSENYDEFTNGYQTAIIYGSENTNGIGVVIAESKSLKLSRGEKSALAANL
ncbi:MAG: WG repeat-containing protein [Paramuribaculum sp.]|nr:WG repeat-containing protein [Paramuribaculum sp.]